MARYTSILYQVVFSTKYRNPCMLKSTRRQLYAYLNGVLVNKKCHVYRINGVEDHLHILFDLHPMVALSMLIKDLKLSSSAMIKESGIFPDFENWQVGYGAFTYSPDAKDNLIFYIKNQEEHHRKKETFKVEFIRMLEENRIEYDLKYVFE